MSKIITDKTNIVAIADAVRSKTGSTEELSLGEILSEIQGISGEATLEISVNSSNGLITATAGTKSSTYQLAFQPATTITPSKEPQMAVSSGYYTGGPVTVDPIPSSYIIPSGTVTISANGTHDVKKYENAVVEVAGSGEADYTNEDGLIEGTLTSYENSRVTKIADHVFYTYKSLTTVSFPACTIIGSNAFRYCSSLTTVNFLACTSIGGYAFNGCSSLTTVNFPACTFIGSYALSGCSRLTTVNFPACTSIGGHAFNGCSSLTTVNFPACTSISTSAFYRCSRLTTVSFPACRLIGYSVFKSCFNLKSIFLGGSSVCTLSNSHTFSSTPYNGYSTYFSGTPYIYVPSSLIASYQAATNWTYFSSYFSAIEDANI